MKSVDHAYENRAAERRKSMTSDLVRSAEQAAALGRKSDLSLEPQRRVESIWALVCELAALRGIDASELRFDRSASRVERRKR